MSENSKNIWCKVKGPSQNMHSGCCSPFKRYVRVNFEWPIRILEITTRSLRLRLKLYGMLTLFWIEYSLLVSQKSQNICQREFILSLMKGLRSVEGILNFTISSSRADFAALSASLFPYIPILLGIQQILTFYPDWKHNNNCTIYVWMINNNNCTIYPRCMDD